MSNDTLDVVLSLRFMIQVDDVSGDRSEYRASLYDIDDNLDLLTQGWGDTPSEAICEAIKSEVL